MKKVKKRKRITDCDGKKKRGSDAIKQVRHCSNQH